MPQNVERIYTSERLSSSHGPDVFYELVFARTNPGDGNPGSDVVMLRMIREGQAAENGSAQIHVKDLVEVQERFNDFVERVRKKIDPNSTSVLRAPTGLPALRPSTHHGMEAAAPMGRYDPNAPRRRPGTQPAPHPGAHTPAPFQISMGPKKAGFPGAGAEPIAPRPVIGGGSHPTPPAEEEAAADRPLNESYRIVSYNLSSPPTVDALMRTIETTGDLLVVVARFDLVQKVEDYLEKASQSGGRAIPTSDFVTVVVEREPKRRNPAAMSKTKHSIASGLQKMLGLPKAVLWIPPEA